MRNPVLIFCLACLIGCKSKELSQFKEDLRRNSESKTIERNGFQITIRNVPDMLRVLEDPRFAGDSILTAEDLARLDSAAGDLKGVLFVLNISPLKSKNDSGASSDLIYSNASGFSDYRQAFQAYQFDLRMNVWLEVSGIKIPASASQMVNSFGIDPGRDFVLTFPDKELRKMNNDAGILFVLDNIVPGLGREKISWKIPKENYDAAI